MIIGAPSMLCGKTEQLVLPLLRTYSLCVTPVNLGHDRSHRVLLFTGARSRWSFVRSKRTSSTLCLYSALQGVHQG